MNANELNSIKVILKSLVISAPDGVNVERLHEDYYKEEGSYVPYKEMGFATFEAFLKSIRDTVVVVGSGSKASVRPVTNTKSMHIQDMVIKQKKKTKPSTHFNDFNNHNYRNRMAITRNQFYNNKKLKRIPQDELLQVNFVEICPKNQISNNGSNMFSNQHHSQISKYKLSQIVNTESRLTIFITEIHSPSTFWFHIHRNCHLLDNLTEKLAKFYNPLGFKELLIPPENITVGVIYAVYYNYAWNRGEVLKLRYNNERKLVVVRLIDFGTVVTVSFHLLKYLLQEFIEYPVQTLCGALSNIQPLKDKWTMDAVSYFVNMVQDKLVFARLTEIVTEREQANLIICYKDNEEIIQVNTALIDDNHAKLVV